MPKSGHRTFPVGTKTIGDIPDHVLCKLAAVFDTAIEAVDAVENASRVRFDEGSRGIFVRPENAIVLSPLPHFSLQG